MKKQFLNLNTNLMKFTVTPKLFSKFPNAKFGALLIEGVDNSKDAPEINELLKKTIKAVVEKHKGIKIKDLPQIQSWRSVFKELGLNRDFLPSHEALLTRVMSKKELPNINPLVDIYNVISLKYLIPIGGHDIDKAPQIRIDETTADETFQVMNNNEVMNVDKGEFAYLCGNKVLTRHFVWRQSDTSKTNKSTKNIFIPIDNAAGDMTKDEIKQIADELTTLITKHLGGRTKFGIVDKESPEINFNKTETVKKNTKTKEKDFDLPRWKKYQDMVKLQEPKMSVTTDEDQIEKVLTRGVKDIFPKKEELKKRMLSGQRLRLYTGIDPTANFLHVGHFIWMRKLAQFQKLGHQVIFLIGAFTGMIGDPDKKYTREPLTKEHIWKNFKSYKETASKILNFGWEKNPVTFLNNYNWLSTVTLEDWLQIMGQITLQHILSHDMFEKRLKEEKPIRLHETMYPLMQGFDSVVMQVDLEVGGSDQTFNMLTGRILSKSLINKEKFVLTLKLLTDPTGEKMGKTTGNAIASTDKPEDMFGKVMSWPDESLLQAFELLTDVDLKKVDKEMRENPMESKKKLAFEIVKMLNNESTAQKAQEHFEKIVQKGEEPEEMKEIKYTGKPVALEFVKFLVKKGLIESNAEAKRLIKQGSIQIDGKKLSRLEQKLNLKKESVVKIGKRKFVRIK